MFKNIGLSRRYEKDIVSEMIKEIDYEKVDRRLNELRNSSHEYIVNALQMGNSLCNKKEQGKTTGHIICKDSDCTGCTACTAVCPKNAITMSMDNCGFWHPIINRLLCINCNRCNQVCPVNHAPAVYGPTKAYAYQNTNEVRFDSSSGGFFHAVASMVIEEGGVVCGASFDKKMVLRHTFIENKEELEPLKRSKYVQSSLDGVFKKVKDYLADGRKVLFAGVGCQGAGLRKFIGHNENLMIIDVVCHGVPSSGLFLDWVDYLGKKYSRVTDVIFRDKSYGYITPNVKVMFENGHYIESCRDTNIYVDLFFRHLSIRESCYSCRFKTVDRASDFTIGDLWRIGRYDGSMDDDRGTTVVFAHTERGVQICNALDCMEIDINKVLNSDSKMMVECSIPARGVTGFWKKYQEDGFRALADTYFKDTLKLRIKYYIKRTMNKAGLSAAYYRYIRITRKKAKEEYLNNCN